ncbi:hypothetical protein GBA52_009235 [Prunus armeniaca]|nr:hypothetical protein GBA52_009235 [Prunus armeniaca]
MEETPPSIETSCSALRDRHGNKQQLKQEESSERLPKVVVLVKSFFFLLFRSITVHSIQTPK